MSIYRDFTMPGVDIAQILWCPEYVYLKRFYGASRMSICRDFA